jgi:RNA recognition motif-containing protein
MSVKLYVGNLPFGTTEQELDDLFSQAGQVESTSIVTDRDTGRSRGFAFVEMDTRESAEAAIQRLNGYEIAGRAIVVNEARPKENRSREGFGGGRGDYGGGRGGYGGGRGGSGGRDRDRRNRGGNRW